MKDIFKREGSRLSQREHDPHSLAVSMSTNGEEDNSSQESSGDALPMSLLVLCWLQFFSSSSSHIHPSVTPAISHAGLPGLDEACNEPLGRERLVSGVAPVGLVVGVAVEE